MTQVPRVLHSRLDDGRQEADVSLLQGEGRPAQTLPVAVGTTASALREPARLHTLSGRLGSDHHRLRSVRQLGLRTRITAILSLSSSCCCASPYYTVPVPSFQIAF